MDLYLDNLLKRYRVANRRQKSELLEELCAASGYHKKHAIRLLNKGKKRHGRAKETRGRPEKYPGTLYLEPLKTIWLCTDQLCGKRLKMALPLWLPHYSKTHQPLEPAVYQGLLMMSASTIDRLFVTARVYKHLGSQSSHFFGPN